MNVVGVFVNEIGREPRLIIPPEAPTIVAAVVPSPVPVPLAVRAALLPKVKVPQKG